MGNSVSLSMEAMAMAGVGILWLLFRSRDSNKEKLAEQGITDNGKEGDQAMDFRYIL